MVDEDAEAPRGVTEAASNLDAGEAVDEEGAEGLVLAMGGVGGFEEDLGEVRYFFWFAVRHGPQMSDWGGLVKSKELPKRKPRENGGIEVIGKAG